MFKPVLNKIHPCSYEEVKNNTQKECRIIDTLEPVLMRHKMIVNTSVLVDDYKVYEKDQQYSLIYQLTRICRDRGALGHDDRLDALTMAVAYWLDVLDRDSDIGMQELLEEDLEKWLDPDRGIAYIEEPENLRPLKKAGRQDYHDLNMLKKFL